MNQAHNLPRRRFLKLIGVCASAAVMPLEQLLAAPTLPGSGPVPMPRHTWQGIVLGAEASLQLLGMDQSSAKNLFSLCLAEINRLESLFSLYRADSLLRVLNAKGSLSDPPPEFNELLTRAIALSDASGGAFDVSIQPLWHALYYHNKDELSVKALRRIHALVDYRAIECSDTQVRLARAGMQLTFNGIAQGFITDKVTALLRKHGVTQALVQLGETYGIGQNAERQPWQVGIPLARPIDAQTSETNSSLATTVGLENQALATSAGAGTLLSNSRVPNHLISAHTGQSPRWFDSVSVLAPNATDADGLSTALSMLPEEKHQSILLRYSGARTFLQVA